MNVTIVSQDTSSLTFTFQGAGDSSRIGSYHSIAL
jgi:hypothetical protein